MSDVSGPSVPERRLSFGATAADYARYRPTYPLSAVRWMLEPVGHGGRVVDVGAGTGALTRVVAAAGYDVTAVEPDPGMLAQLRADLPQVAAAGGSAEAVPLPDGSADAVVAGQAWHWFDPPAATAEFARVLRPGGVLGLVWNIRDDSVPWMAALSGLIGGEDTLRASREPDSVRTDVVPLFHEPERAAFPWTVTHTADSLVDLVSTYSYVRLSPHAQRILTDVRQLATTHPDLAGRETFELPYVATAYRAGLAG